MAAPGKHTGTGGRRAPGSGDGLTFLPREELIPWPGLNPRRRFDEAALQELRATIEQDGLLQPIGVRLMPEPPHYIYAGERRWRASEGILHELPCITREISEAAAHRLALTENVQRSDLTAVEEAWAIQAYMDAASGLGDEDVEVVTQTDVAREVGRSQAWVANRLRLLRLPEDVLELIQDEKLTATQARDLILPFAALPTEKWEQLAGAVAKALTKIAKRKEPLGDEELRIQVSNVACAMSWWLDSPLWGPSKEDTSQGWGTGVRIPRERWKSAPKGTVVRYVYGHYGVDSSRAFDFEWWAEEMRAEEARQTAERDAVINGDDEEEHEAADLDWSPDLGVIGADVEVAYHQRHVVVEARSGNSWDRDALGRLGDEDVCQLHADPTLIPEDCLVIQEGAPAAGKYGRARQLAVLCTRADVFEAAERGLEEKHTELVRRRKAQALKEDLRAAEQWKLGSPGSLIAVYLIGLLDIDLEVLEELAEAAGVALAEIPHPEDQDWEDDPVVRRRQQLEKLSPNDLDRLFRFGAARLERGGLDAFTRGGQEGDVGRELRAQLIGELRAKLQPALLAGAAAALFEAYATEVFS